MTGERAEDVQDAKVQIQIQIQEERGQSPSPSPVGVSDYFSRLVSTPARDLKFESNRAPPHPIVQLPVPPFARHGNSTYRCI